MNPHFRNSTPALANRAPRNNLTSCLFTVMNKGNGIQDSVKLRCFLHHHQQSLHPGVRIRTVEAMNEQRRRIRIAAHCCIQQKKKSSRRTYGTAGLAAPVAPLNKSFQEQRNSGCKPKALNRVTAQQEGGFLPRRCTRAVRSEACFVLQPAPKEH